MFRKKHLVTHLGKGQEKEGVLVPVLLILLIGSVAGVGYFLSRDEEKGGDRVVTAPAPTAASSTKQEIIAAVEKMTILPQGEEPVLGTVQDPALLRDQPFFQFAERGDRVLIYQRAKRAILYRPSTGKIIETMPFEVPLQVR
jgi:hypothetical protein